MGFHRAMCKQIAFLAAFAAAAALLAAQGNTPDRIYLNGTVITMNGARIVQAVAVRGDRIVGAGSDSEMRKMAGAGTAVSPSLEAAITWFFSL